MTNPFDSGISYDSVALDGLFSKIKKGVKNVARKIDKSARFVKSKIVPKQIDNIRKKIKKEVLSSPIGVAAVMVAGSVLVGPAVAAIAGKLGVASAAAIKGATVVAKKAVSNAVQKGYQKTATQKAKNKLKNQTDQIAAVNAKIASDPDFQKVVVGLKKAGKSDAEIVKTWASSNTAKTLAQAQTAKILMPQVAAQLRSDPKIAQKDVPALASELSKQMAAEAVNAAQVKAVAPVVNSPNQSPVLVTSQPTPPTIPPILPMLAIATTLLS